MGKNQLYRQIPKVDILLESDLIQECIQIYGKETVKDAIRTEIDCLRSRISACQDADQEEIEKISQEIPLLGERIQSRIEKIYQLHMKHVINGTGMILHTNLGRAPLSHKHLEQVINIASGYSNLEYHLESGKRGERYSHFEELVCKITGAEAAIAVNNNAASVLLILSTLAKGGEVIVSRGELVEIGGKFRIPDVCLQSQAILKEVGTTNKTRIEDYENAISDQTKALLKVHTSNYKIIGFTQSVSTEEVAILKEKYDLPFIEDLGSGVLIDLEKYGLNHEKTVQETVSAGADIVCFSGDKLLGGPQAGIIVGKKKYIDQMKKNPLLRAIRIDKFTAAALEVVFREYLSESKAVKNIPVLSMIAATLDEIENKAKKLYDLLSKGAIDAEVKLEDSKAQIGGGSLPEENLLSKAVTVKPNAISVNQFEERLRLADVPVIGRIADDRFWIDLRTVFETDILDLVQTILKCI